METLKALRNFLTDAPDHSSEVFIFTHHFLLLITSHLFLITSLFIFHLSFLLIHSSLFIAHFSLFISLPLIFVISLLNSVNSQHCFYTQKP